MIINKKRIRYLILILLILFGISSFFKLQQKMFFHPTHDKEAYKELEQIEIAEKININDKLYGWLIHNSVNEKAPLLIFFGGNMQNSSNTCLNIIKEEIKYFGKYNILIIYYPGYGISLGTPSNKTMFKMAKEVYDYALTRKDVDKDKICVLGFSIGTGVATYLASERDIDGLILIAPYDKALSLYNNCLNIFHGPLKILARYKFESIKYAKDVKVSPLIFSSYDDEVIDYNLSVNLSNYFSNIYEFVTLDNVGHNEYFSQKIVLEKIKGYLSK